MIKPSFTTSCGEKIPVIIDARRGLRNITIRPKTMPTREIHISKPWLVPTSSALHFLKQKTVWLDKIFACAPKKVKIHDGDTIEFLGRRVLIKHDATKKSNCLISTLAKSHLTQLAGGVSAQQTRGVTSKSEVINHPPTALRAEPPRKQGGTCSCEVGETLVIGGSAEMLERRIRDFIKAEFLTATREIIKTAPREFWPKRLAIRDTTSRWGSCSSSGTISFSWRLAFASPEIMRYVIMHELAHKKHMDHSPAFWKQVSELYGPGVERAKQWLAKNGQDLHRYF